jgi:hypothetical protein
MTKTDQNDPIIQIVHKKWTKIKIVYFLWTFFSPIGGKQPAA